MASRIQKCLTLINLITKNYYSLKGNQNKFTFAVNCLKKMKFNFNLLPAYLQVY